VVGTAKLAAWADTAPRVIAAAILALRIGFIKTPCVVKTKRKSVAQLPQEHPAVALDAEGRLRSAVNLGDMLMPPCGIEVMEM
jgi:hypothetical protein